MAVHHWMMRSLLIGGILFTPTMADAGEPEYVSIQTLLLPQAASYQQHMVTVQGVASNIEIIPETSPRTSKKRCVLVYGRATFTLDDETGSLPIEVLGSCSPIAMDMLPREGETVRLTGTVHVLKSDYPRHVIVQAATIQILNLP
ncbi:OB-fold nucleic acid binding domain-containing protein [Nitrospira sp. CMX1]